MIIVLFYTWTCWIHFGSHSCICCVIRVWCCKLWLIDYVRAIHLKWHLTYDWNRFLILDMAARDTILFPWNSDTFNMIWLILHCNSHSFSNSLLLVLCDVATLAFSSFLCCRGGRVSQNYRSSIIYACICKFSCNTCCMTPSHIYIALPTLGHTYRTNFRTKNWAKLLISSRFNLTLLDLFLLLYLWFVVLFYRRNWLCFQQRWSILCYSTRITWVKLKLLAWHTHQFSMTWKMVIIFCWRARISMPQNFIICNRTNIYEILDLFFLSSCLIDQSFTFICTASWGRWTYARIMIET